MADMQVSVGFRWKAGGDFPAEFIGFEIIFDDIADKIGWRCVGFPWQSILSWFFGEVFFACCVVPCFVPIHKWSFSAISALDAMI